ncbi:hypothetical protein OKJ48_29485 [Streptomyces kunmingensis]|uniref:Integral membrane protein n=1 Tax=Streptomyces kunmingensis TaxID=68225 RepID=A0ABU6CIZ0_9ACTN|nr:hypothetical protein [Streptomyces kunmingensis]MEB3964335.1 hypothetical protein [Streptomyces kunmingensis]
MTESKSPEAAAQERADVLRERLKERIYASLTLLAVLVSLAQSRHPGPTAAAVSVAVTALGLWLATLVADLQARPVAHGRMPRLPEIRHTVFTSSPLLTSAVGPLLLIGLSAAGVLELTTALWVSVGSEVAALAFWGFTGGRRVGAGPLGALVTAALNAVIGVGVVAVKLAAGH